MGVRARVGSASDAGISFVERVSLGLVPYARIYHITGQNNIIAVTPTLDDITELTPVVAPQPGGLQLEIVSASANDTSAGTGIQTADLHYLDNSYVEQVKTLELDGTTPVLTVVSDINHIQWLNAKTVGSGGVAAGDISLRGVGAGTVYEKISQGGGQSLSCRITVPAGHTGHILGWHASGIKKRIDFRLRAQRDRFDSSLLPAFLFQDSTSLENAPSGWIPFSGWVKCAAQAQVKVSAKADLTGGEGSAGFTIMFIEDAA